MQCQGPPSSARTSPRAANARGWFGEDPGGGTSGAASMSTWAAIGTIVCCSPVLKAAWTTYGNSTEPHRAISCRAWLTSWWAKLVGHRNPIDFSNRKELLFKPLPLTCPAAPLASPQGGSRLDGGDAGRFAHAPVLPVDLRRGFTFRDPMLSIPAQLACADLLMAIR